MDVSVIIPCFNVASTLGDQLDALAAQETDHSWEVLIVDNNSTDATRDVARSYADRLPALRIVDGFDGQGISYARNVGIAASEARSIVLCDGDDIVAPGWLDAIATALDDHELVTGSFELDLLNPPWLAESRGGGDRSTDPPRFLGTFPYARGGNLGARRSLVDAVGGFAETVTGSEDVEFSLRCLDHGVEVVPAPGAVLHYRYRGEGSVLFRQGRTYGRGRPHVVRLMIERGHERPPRFAGWKSWIWLVTRLPLLATTVGRARWLWVAGNRVGQIEGSIRHRTIVF